MARRVVELERRDPPPRRHSGGCPTGTVQRDWKGVAEFLEAHPGEWYVIDHGYGSVVKSGGRPSALRRAEIDMATRAEDDGSLTTYARWRTEDTA